ncbi:autotransporter outer membrane beta-barrel domain-containing protein [Pandoraea commovens]|uniref:Extracellular serine protease n=1 Tax=Pandoraea commovens TaxID=2508289 RepID=A0A5E4Y9F2_9BURK|nr:autotransporter outer membrane beta-barrel domain-containing protein [Pandoraea commovens]VVE45369.1 Extracellular serine protease [Pandoraea commovens]
MRGNLPKSYALCQTKIYAAIIMAVAVIGGAPNASAGSLQSSGIENREQRLKELIPLDEHQKNVEKEKTDDHGKNMSLLGTEIPIHNSLTNITDAKELKKALGNQVEDIQSAIDVVQKRIDEGKELPKDRDLIQALNVLRGKVDALANSQNPLAGPERTALDDLLTRDANKFKESLAALVQAKKDSEVVGYKLQRWRDADDEKTASRLSVTKELNASANGVDLVPNTDYVTWNDKNQINFMSDDAPVDGQSLIDAETTLEISARSGRLSDAIYGATNQQRDVGTIRAVNGANHTVRVDGGTLSVHQGIDGEGTLTMNVGSKGALNFVEGGEGISDAAQHVTLSAGKSDGQPPDAPGGTIEFFKGTSAGAARLQIHDAGALTFNPGSTGGRSVIDVEKGGVVGFDEANAADATIFNSGFVGMRKARGGAGVIENRKDGLLAVVDSDLETRQIVNAGLTNLSGTTTADSATIAMEDGVLSLVDFESNLRDDPPAERSLTIGSLSGSGQVITGGKTLKLGALGKDDVFSGDIVKLDTDKVGATVAKVGTGNLTFSGDQSGIDSLTVENGTLTAAHRNALGTGLLALWAPGTISLANDVYDVRKFENAGTLKLHGYRIVMDEYESKGKDARIESDAKRDPNAPDEVHRGTIHIKKKGDFTDTKIVLTPDGSVTPKELLDKKIQVVTHDPDADVKLGEVDYGSIPTQPGEGGGDGGDGDVVIDPGKEIAFLDPSAPYTGNEKGLLDSLQGVTLNDIIEGRVGGAVLGQLVLLPAGSAEQRRAARMLSGESLVNNADAAYNASDAFRSSMQTRMLAGGSLPDCNATNGQRAGQNGVSVWGSFKGAGANRSDGEQSFSISGIDGAFGVDKRLNQNALVGVAFGLGSRTSRADDLPGDASIRSASVGLYGSYLSDARWFANGGLFFTNHNVTTERTVAAHDVSARVSGKTSGRTLGLFGEVGQRVLAGGMNVDPFIGMRIASTRLNGYDETDRDAGQGNNGLHVGSQISNSRRAILGVRLWRELVNTSGGSVIPSLRLAYEHEFGDTQSSLTNAIYGAPRAFTVKGVKLGRDIFTADLGADVRVTRQLNVHVGGNLSLRSGEKAIAGGVTAKYMF